MNARQANKIPITDYLEAIGIMPTRMTIQYSMYHSPFRNDRNPSLKVSHTENLWIDYGEGTGGTLIDLVLKIKPNLNISEAIKEISETNNTFFSFHQQKTLSQKHSNGEESRFGSWNAPDPKHDSMGGGLQTENLLADREKMISTSCTDNIYNLISKTGADKIQHLKDNTATSNICTDNTEYLLSKTATHKMGTSNTEHLTDNRGTINIYKLQDLGNNPMITSYLNQRGIAIATAKPYCHEIYYHVKEKRYFGLAHRNIKGWCIRNKYWKGCTAQGYSYYNNQQTTLLIFEGIFDFLSFLELKCENKVKADILILNSLVNIKKSIPILQGYQSIELYLDHDDVGRKATYFIQKQLSNAQDTSKFYSSHKDLNEYHLTKVKGRTTKEVCHRTIIK